MTTYEPEALTEADAAEAKAAAGGQRDEPRWRGDLFANVPAAVTWANTDPVSGPGTIVFSVRDNGQVWTFTFL
jgi:hypothetical protein